MKKLQKTMIACRSQHQATQVKHYFDNINDVRSEFMDRMPTGYWTLEKCKEVAINYKTVKEIEKENRKINSFK